jgi:predicted chitinase
MLTDQQLHAIMPRLPPAKRTTFLPLLDAAMAKFAINAPPRHAAFLAQLAHESGELRFMEELWGPTPAQRRYEPPSTLATRLGNTEPGDGKRFKGRGPIQITGRDNYRRFGALLGVDLVSTPTLAALPDLAFRIAGLFWMKNGLNELADTVTATSFKEITRRINGGLNGLAERERLYALACAVLGVPAAAPPGVPRGGARPSGSVPPAPVFERGAEAIEIESRRRAAKRKTGATARTKTKSTARKTTRR